MEDYTQKIITDGVWAPSGENCQPWKFAVKENQISIFNIPEADTSLYNYDQKGSYVAHGALLENINISALKHGYKPNIELFPDDNEVDLVSVITLDKIDPNIDPLYSYLEKRCTNRKEYNGQKLTEEQKRVLIQSAKETNFGEFAIIDDDKFLNILGSALAANEQIIFENKELHDFFYNHILWNEEDQGKA